MAAPDGHGYISTTKTRWSQTACLWYLNYYASEVLLFPFINVYLQGRGLNGRSIGIIGAVRPWVGVPVSILLTSAADYWRQHQLMMLVLTIASVAVRCLLLAVPAGLWPMMAVCVAMECLQNPVIVLSDTATMAGCTEDGEYGKYRMWGAIGWGVTAIVAGGIIDRWGMGAGFITNLLLMLPCCVLGWCLHYPQQCTHLTSMHATEGLDGEARRHTTRSCGTIVSLSVPFSHVESGHRVSGQLVDSSEDEELPVEVEILTPGVEILTPDCMKRWTSVDADEDGEEHANETATLLGPGSCHYERKCGSSTIQGESVAELSFLSKVKVLVTSPAVGLFLITAFIMGAAYGVFTSYLFLMLADMGSTHFLMGLTLTVSCAAEVPFFHYLGYFIKLCGVDRLLDISLGCYALRMFLYGALPWMGNPYFVLPMELLHGVTFGAGWGAGCEQVKMLAPKGLEATVQTLFQGCYFGLGCGAGSLFGGVIGHRYGYQVMFFCTTVFVLLGWGLVVLGRICTNRRMGKHDLA